MLVLTILISVAIIIISPCSSSAKIEPRIYGGFFAKPKQLPFQAALYINGRFGCGAAIYTDIYILTAAHCVLNEYTNELYQPKQIQILAGIIDLRKKNDVEYYSVKRISRHYNYTDDKNDIAIVELSKPLKFSDSVQPIELYSGNDFKSGNEVLISGWGLNENGFSLPLLKYHKLTANVQPKCGDDIEDYYDGSFCILHTKNNGMCYGDSGGPAVANGKLIGIANIVIWDCGTTKPDVYAYIPFYLNWIKEYTFNYQHNSDRNTTAITVTEKTTTNVPVKKVA